MCTPTPTETRVSEEHRLGTDETVTVTGDAVSERLRWSDNDFNKHDYPKDTVDFVWIPDDDTGTEPTFHCTTDTQVYDGHDIGHSDPDCTLTIHRDQVTVD